MKTFKPGDKVKWGAAQGAVRGTVEQKITAEARVKGHVAKASRERPQYKVKSAKTGAEAIHKPEELRRD